MLPLLLTLLLIQFGAGASFKGIGLIVLILFVLPTFVMYYLWFSTKKGRKEVQIPEIIRVPAKGKIEDCDYHMELEGGHIWWNMFNCNINGFLSPYEIVLVQMSGKGLVREQELMHAKIGTCCNKQFEKDYGFPAYSKVQVGWKRFTNFWRRKAPRVNEVVLATLESCFIFFVDFWSQFPGLFKRYINHWVLAYHLMEECEHGHLTAEQLNDKFDSFEAMWGFLLTLGLVLFISLVLVPIHCIFYFPRKALSVRGLLQAIEYFFTVMAINLYMTYGGMILFLFRASMSNKEVMKVYRKFEKHVYNPYCRDNGLMKHTTPKYKIAEIEERLVQQASASKVSKDARKRAFSMPDICPNMMHSPSFSSLLQSQRAS